MITTCCFRYVLVYSFIGRILLVLSVAPIAASVVNAQGTETNTIPPSHAVSVMKRLEAKLRVLQWKAHCENAKLDDGNDPDSIVEKSWPETDAEVVLDVATGRYRCQISGTYEWIDGLAPTGSSIEEHAFDGELYQCWKRIEPGQDLPSPVNSPVMGWISEDRGDIAGVTMRKRDYIHGDSVSEFTGVAFMPPYFLHRGIYPPQPLSSLLQTLIDDGREISIVEDDRNSEVWKIAVSGKDIELGHLHMSYDIEKGGVVTEAEWITSYGPRNHSVNVELKKSEGGIWIPRSVERIDHLDRRLCRVEYENIKINPPVNADTFRCDFPNGCKVENFAEKRTYVVGSLADRQSQIRQFAQEHGFPGDGKAASFPTLGVLIVVSGCLAVVFAVVVLMRKRRARC